MPKLKIIRRRDGDWTGLAYDDGSYKREDMLPLGFVTSAEYAALCDQTAAGLDCQDFCGVHASLDGLLKGIGKHTALLVMRRIAQAGGLMALRAKVRT